MGNTYTYIVLNISNKKTLQKKKSTDLKFTDQTKYFTPYHFF